MGICGELLGNFITILRWMLIDLVAGKEEMHSYFKSENISILKFCLTSFPAMNAYIIFITIVFIAKWGDKK